MAKPRRKSKQGVVRFEDVLRALKKLGGKAYPHGGEFKVLMYGTKLTEVGHEECTSMIIIGRRDFSRPMLRVRVDAKLVAVGIPPSKFYELL